MNFASTCGSGSKRRGWVLLLATMMTVFLETPGNAMPARLVVAVDGIAYRDMAALQAGVPHTNFWGRRTVRRAFTAEDGYYPVSRMVSSFPSASDVAWTEIFGDRPLPGYQRTYFCKAANQEISLNGVTTTVEHEKQMDYQLQNGFFRALGYLYPMRTYNLEIFHALREFRRCPPGQTNFYIYLRATDDAQHLDRDIQKILCDLDRRLQKLRAECKAETGRDLQIVILSDHGHNHAGRGRRVEVSPFLEKLGYRVAETIAGPKDVVLPTVGVESWVEVHNAPEVTETLVEQLCHLEGADVITASLPGQSNRFLVMNAKSERAFIDWRPESGSYRYDAERGDPLDYLPAVEALRREHKLDADGYASADDWMDATMKHRYPLALERIARGLAHNTLNPATIIISLDNSFVHDSWLTQSGSRLVTCRSTHGGLDDLCSNGILLSNFQPTRDTSTLRVAAQFDDFGGLRNFREEENGAEWFAKKAQAAVRIQRRPLDRDFALLPDNGIFLRVWSPQFKQLDGNIPLTAVIEKMPDPGPSRIGRGYAAPEPEKIRIAFPGPVLPVAAPDCERIYGLSSHLVLEPRTEYKMSGWISADRSQHPLFVLNFSTDAGGRPLVY